MGIKYKPKQGPEISARAGAATGAAEKAKTEQRINLALEAEERAKMWELTKMELSSQQQYAHEARMRQVELDKEARAHEWVIEKAEIASRMDFQRQEEERQRKLSELDAQEKAIQEAKEKYGDNPAIQQKAFELWRQRLAVTTGVTPGHYRPTQQGTKDQFGQYINELITGGEGVPTPDIQNSAAAQLPSIQPGYVAAKSPSGEIRQIRIEDVQSGEAAKEGWEVLPGQIPEKSKTIAPFVQDIKNTFDLSRRWAIKVKSPDGDIIEIDSRELSQYKKKGYIPVKGK